VEDCAMIRVGMIGAGNFATVHLRALAQEPDVEIVAHVSASGQRAQANARAYGGSAFAGVEAFVDEAHPDAAWICTPPGAHGPIEDVLIRRKIPFFVEKPLAADLKTAEEIARALDASRIIAAVGYHWRAMDTIPDVRKTLASARVLMVSGVWLDAPPPSAWWYRAATGGGQMLEQATHLIDLARLLVGEAEVAASAATGRAPGGPPDADVPAASTALLRFQDGVPGVFSATCALTVRAAVHLQLACEGLFITIARNEAAYEDASGRRSVPLGNDPFAAEDRAFLAALNRNEPSLLFSPYADALRTHRLCWKITSMAQGRR
jgi:predicted dehydrogenase